MFFFFFQWEGGVHQMDAVIFLRVWGSNSKGSSDFNFLI